MSTGRGSDMQDSLSLMQFHDPYLYSGGAGGANLPLSHSFLPHHQGFVHTGDERCPGSKDVPEFVDQATAEVISGEQELAASKEVSEGGGDGAVEEQSGAATAMGGEEEAHGVRMIALLMECAVAVSVGNLADANGMLLELAQMSSPYASSCGERLVAYFTKAMAARLMSSWVGICAPLAPPCAAVHAAFRAFYNVSPLARFAYLACNQAILEAFHGKRLVHIVDLDVVPGGALQWLSLLPALAARPGGPPLLRVTGFGMSASALHDTGNQLAGLASKLSMPFEFYAIAKRPGDVDAAAAVPSRRPGEALAVHWLQHAMYDAAGDDGATMRLVRWLEPKVLTLVEQERGGAPGVDGGGAVNDHGHFLDRFVSALHHYSALFDSLGASRPADEDASRHLVEHGVLGREIGNVLAVGGPSRSGRDKFGCWQSELARHGFLHAGGAGRAQLVAGACPAGLGYTVADDHDGTVRLGWKGTPLYAVSTWTWCPSPHAQR
ncbi:Protein SCARECROW [Dichanthelium oligosanthes]|uniref:Protein SCARECROW n=1 Tax=Dichanthelium oligosanthes TaxID=888268 RepID=A0A1E5V1Z1_9POAL|nr:Protein SCARECROW [Dichanthelium oligosanthes]